MAQKIFSILESDRQKKINIFLGAMCFTIAYSIADISLMSLADASPTSISIIPEASGSCATTGDETDLGCAFQTGNFSFKLILLYGLHLIRVMGVLAGVVYMIMNIYAGITYIVGTTAGDKEAGSNAMINAFIGFGLAIFSWIIVDIIIAFFTT